MKVGVLANQIQCVLFQMKTLHNQCFDSFMRLNNRRQQDEKMTANSRQEK